MQCLHNAVMAVQITIRNVPDHVRDELATRAASRRQSMQEFLLQELEKLVEKPSIEDWLARVRVQKKVMPRQISSEMILGSRDLDRK